jgi:hypothetical protein
MLKNKFFYFFFIIIINVSVWVSLHVSWVGGIQAVFPISSNMP